MSAAELAFNPTLANPFQQQLPPTLPYAGAETFPRPADSVEPTWLAYDAAPTSLNRATAGAHNMVDRFMHNRRVMAIAGTVGSFVGAGTFLLANAESASASAVCTFINGGYQVTINDSTNVGVSHAGETVSWLYQDGHSGDSGATPVSSTGNVNLYEKVFVPGSGSGKFTIRDSADTILKIVPESWTCAAPHTSTHKTTPPPPPHTTRHTTHPATHHTTQPAQRTTVVHNPDTTTAVVAPATHHRKHTTHPASTSATKSQENTPASTDGLTLGSLATDVPTTAALSGSESAVAAVNPNNDSGINGEAIAVIVLGAGVFIGGGFAGKRVWNNHQGRRTLRGNLPFKP